MPEPAQYHFTGVYPDDAISRAFGRTRHWTEHTANPGTVVDAHLVGLFPFESVTFTRCPEQRMMCSCR